MLISPAIHFTYNDFAASVPDDDNVAPNTPACIMYNTAAVAAYIEELGAPPPPGAAHAVALPGTEKPNRSQIYRHWQFADRPLLETLDPAVRTLHDLFESSVQQFPKNACLGARKWRPDAGTWDNKFSWLTYAEVAQRRKNFGAGVVELHSRINHDKQGQYPVALWAPNKPEWQIVGRQPRLPARHWL